MSFNHFYFYTMTESISRSQWKFCKAMEKSND
jgi:hypothetical protein